MKPEAVKTAPFVKRIEACNQKIRPVLQNEKELIGEKLVPLRMELKAREEEYEPLRLQYDALMEQLIMLRELLEAGKLSQEDRDSQAATVRQEMDNLDPGYSRAKIAFHSVKEKVESLESTQARINWCLADIDKYFNDHQPLV